NELYDLLVSEQGPEAYRLYRSLLRRLVSLENALEIRPESVRTTIKKPSSVSAFRTSQADKRTGLRRSLHPDGEEPLWHRKTYWRSKVVYGRLLIAQGARPRCSISNPQSTIFNRCAYQLRYFTPNAG